MFWLLSLPTQSGRHDITKKTLYSGHCGQNSHSVTETCNTKLYNYRDEVPWEVHILLIIYNIFIFCVKSK